MFLGFFLIVYYIYKPCIIAPNQEIYIWAKNILLGFFLISPNKTEDFVKKVYYLIN